MKRSGYTRNSQRIAGELEDAEHRWLELSEL